MCHPRNTIRDMTNDHALAQLRNGGVAQGRRQHRPAHFRDAWDRLCLVSVSGREYVNFRGRGPDPRCLDRGMGKGNEATQDDV